MGLLASETVVGAQTKGSLIVLEGSVAPYCLVFVAYT